MISLVTISFNQGRFLERALQSVLAQNYLDLEYIVIDAGSADDSQSIILKYRDRLHLALIEPDRGPADGLNKGFRHSRGDILGFLNADDMLLPGALTEVASFFSSHAAVDVVSAHTVVVDERDRRLRRSFSDSFSLTRNVYGACNLMQASTFFRRSIYLKTSGFNEDNRSNWDGELFVDMALAGARFAIVNRYWSVYRLHGESITGSGKLDDKIKAYRKRMFARVMGRNWQWKDNIFRVLSLVAKYTLSPQSFIERLRYGPVYLRRNQLR